MIYLSAAMLSEHDQLSARARFTLPGIVELAAVALQFDVQREEVAPERARCLNIPFSGGT
jgi:hypothetical protein